MRVELSLTTKNLEPLSADLEFVGLKFSSDQEFFKKEILSDDYKKAIGLFGAETYKRSPYFFQRAKYSTTEINVADNVKQIINTNMELYRIIFGGLMSFLWLQKDNCCSIDSIYVFLPEHKTVFQHTTGLNYSTCKGVVNEKMSFTNSEIQGAFHLYAKACDKFYHRNIQIVEAGEVQVNVITDRTMTPYDIKKETRLERALNFLDFARRTSHLPQKIAFFMCIYETLFFWKQTTEISHQIAERVALYLTNNRNIRHSIYKLIKEAYSIRSIYFHGGSFKKVKNSFLSDVSEGIDSLTRQLLNKVIAKDADIFLQAEDALEKSFMDLIFEDERRSYSLTVEAGLTHLRFNK
jgi:hypothetical protein